MGVRLGTRRAGAITLAGLLVAEASGQAHLARAEDAAAPPGVGSHEIWGGIDAGSTNWLAYSGTTYAPWSDIHADGFRIRITDGYGQYNVHLTKLRATKTYVDALAGYQMRFGELTAKAFLGYAALSQEFEFPSVGWRFQKLDMGLKGALELWLNIGRNGWASLDANYADTQATWSVRSRFGYRILPAVSIGPEAVINHSNLPDEVAAETSKTYVGDPHLSSAIYEGNPRFGGFVRYEWFGGEISASAGYTGDWIEHAKGSTELLHDPQVYGTLNLILQF